MAVRGVKKSKNLPPATILSSTTLFKNPGENPVQITHTGINIVVLFGQGNERAIQNKTKHSNDHHQLRKRLKSKTNTVNKEALHNAMHTISNKNHFLNITFRMHYNNRESNCN